MCELQLYIPYIPNNITKSIISYYFHNENIGEIINTRMYNKVNDTGVPYFVGIMDIILYNTEKAQDFYTKLYLNGGYRFIYDEEGMLYWIIRLYNDVKIQKNNDDIVPINEDNIPIDIVKHSHYSINKLMPITIYTHFQDYLHDAIAFENITREIDMTIRNYTYELYGM